MEIVTIRMTPHTKELLQEKAQEANMSKLKILRGDDLVDGYAKLTAQVGELTKAVK